MTGRGAEQRAADLLVFYMAKAWEAAGLTWESDNETEVRIIIDSLMDAAVARVSDRIKNTAAMSAAAGRRS